MRFEKLVADCVGVSRRDAKALIKKGLCEYEGEVVKDAAKNVEPARVTVSGKTYPYEEFIYIMMNKPQGVVSATEDERQKTVLDLLPEYCRRRAVFPAGRLDIDAEGFLLLTNNGKCAHDLLAPAKKVRKRYFVRLENPLLCGDIKKLESGVDIGGYITLPCRVFQKTERECEIEITEGKFHQVKKMFETVGNKVVYLKRISFAGLSLDESLAPGEYRALSVSEVDIIKRAVKG